MAKEVIIIGAGAAGMMAAKELCTHGYAVTVLEARARLGGRICTDYGATFSWPVELGAEFVHGKLPATLLLLKEAGIPYHATGGDMVQATNDEAEEDQQITGHWSEFKKQIKALKKDVTIEAFLGDHFSNSKYAALRASVRGYASGYDTADPARASAMALAEEWLAEDHEEQYRINKGYQQLIGYLEMMVLQNGGNIYTNCEVKHIAWSSNAVTVTTSNGTEYMATQVIITVPLSILQASANDDVSISFTPAMPHITEAARKMAMGSLIKILIEFTGNFWKKAGEKIEKNLDDTAFLFSHELIPTWWTQNPECIPLLTGWLGGLKAEALKDTGDDDVLQMSVESLSGIFKIEAAEIRENIVAWKVVNWSAERYTRGSYSYATVETNAARTILEAPIEHTLYIAGEAMYNGPEMGTVEAALSSGLRVAALIRQ